MPARVQISWSALQRHEHCRQKDYLVRAQPRGPTSKDIRNFVHGNIADRLVRRLLMSDDPQPGMMASWLDEQFEIGVTLQGELTADGLPGDADGIVRWRSSNDRAITKNFIREVIVAAEPFLFHYVIPHPYQADYKFKTEILVPYLDGSLAPVVLAGAMDILARPGSTFDTEKGLWVGGRFHGIDLKATKNDQYINKTLGQAIFYDVALLSLYGETGDWNFLQPACKDPWPPVDITDADRLLMLQRIHRMATFMWQGDHTPKTDNKECSVCEVKDGCVKFRPIQDSTGQKRLSFSAPSLAVAQPTTP